ncbi:D-alanyl-D-alanine carboxypeptidase [Roseobacter denitrificans]|uniref:serine-type D-Ala-D-Ala carboxypeptidase n=1 Tax=Roseobacter denitrificans (strain ATCC 33942 / OCh 114) TaxID=375451 RepID=Q162Z3_ROSDO|nr:D-alanyl-D-alanine carboxypeptidase family protein [Roseobacter denitrificans]ABG32950.1 D-alanyl-D-alanine carboxypeptidase [Roseobacter denitrificans OCh 114]AVL52340.1 D-alanyl-D-alanine carboxypeptidase [Roseobacter denitrificans]SFG10629.1 D-alanyl-D-alanine carboxypeptidase (penicillin-binding protein 5/6) [Roseobacter denitrificans OCh 114]
MFRILLAAFVLVASTLTAAAFETRASAAFVMDQTTGTVLLNKNADAPLPPASMSKLMTLYMAFEAVRRGKADGGLDLNERLPVSEHAQSYGGSSMFLRSGETVSVEDLLRGIIVVSGNDACVVIAEALSPDGTEYGFARMMTQRAQQLGMNNSVFINASGWPQTGHVMSMRDLAILADRLITDFPEFYPMFAETEFPFDNRVPSNSRNRNPVLTMGIGADGLKTGHTQEAGYGLVGSAKQGDRRIIFVITGLETTAARAQESQAIVNWAFRQFAMRDIGKAGQEFAKADVWMGSSPQVGLVAAEDMSVLMPALAEREIEAEVVFTGPIEAPIAKGDPLGELVFTPEGLPEMRLPLVADQDVPSGGFVTRMMTAAMVLVTTLIQGPEEQS